MGANAGEVSWWAARSLVAWEVVEVAGEGWIGEEDEQGHVGLGKHVCTTMGAGARVREEDRCLVI